MYCSEPNILGHLAHQNICQFLCLLEARGQESNSSNIWLTALCAQKLEFKFNKAGRTEGAKHLKMRGVEKQDQYST